MSSIPPLISSLAEEHRDRDGELLDLAALTPQPVFHACKRCIDFLLALVMLVLLTPVWLLIAVLIKIDSHGPVLFVNRAVGQYGREFLLYKFRSMRPAEQSDLARADVSRNILNGTPTTYVVGRPIYKTALAERARITRIGRFLRRTSLDELPQLWNILRGDLSFVGPRPSLPDEVSQYKDWQKQRLLVPQGLTGLYQVSARNRVSIEEMIRIDLEYI
ncbi:MAG TPA: sugar transferase, partial [Candidatus Acidoferrum sp.]|nr:sugar transferase [Candidatus Acidoferrum sp.]